MGQPVASKTRKMNAVKCPVCGVDARVVPYPDRRAQFVECPACGSFDVPETTVLLILRGLSGIERAVLSFWLRHQARGKGQLALNDELVKRIVKEEGLPPPDEQEENLIRIVGDALETGKTHVDADLRYFASQVGAPDERTLRRLVSRLLEKDILTGPRNFAMVETGEVNAIQFGLTPDGSRKYRELRSKTVPRNRPENAKVFLSHASSDERIALVLKAEIERRLPGVKVFCSSDPTDLPPGTKWSPEIQQALQQSSMLVFIASDRSLQRPWVWFECGTFWFTGRKIVPLCLGGVRKNALRPPLSELQAVNGHESNDLKTAFDSVAAATGAIFGDAADVEGLAEKLSELDREAAAAARASSGWFGAEWNGKFLAYEGPYESLPKIEDGIFEISMQRALEAAGYAVSLYDENHFDAPGDAVRLVQLTDRRSWRRRIAKGTMWLVARPTKPSGS